MNKKQIQLIYVIIVFLFISCTVTNIFAARYYRLLEKERLVFLGLRGIDTLAAAEYLDLPSATERARFYGDFWQNKTDEERQEFEERIEYAFWQFGRYAPLSDDRIPTYVKYGPPSKREEITPEKKIAIKTTEVVKPAEVWTYRKYGLIFDFVRIARAYKKIAESKFGEQVKIPYVEEVASDTSVELLSQSPFEFNIRIGRFRQKKNLTRLELYITCELEDTVGLTISRTIRIFDKEDSLIKEKKIILVAQNSNQGTFFDEVNFWLEPEDYRLEVKLADIKHERLGEKSFEVSLVDYQDDAKKISDLIPAQLVDRAFTHEKFNKPVGRVIPLTHTELPVYNPFYFYAEVYNLETKDGEHSLRTTYEVTNKEKMRREIVDVMIKDHIEAGDVAYLAAEYHPMDLSPGTYIMTLRVKDLLSGEERNAVSEFELRPIE